MNVLAHIPTLPQSLGPDDPNVAKTLNNLANAYVKQASIYIYIYIYIYVCVCVWCVWKGGYSILSYFLKWNLSCLLCLSASDHDSRGSFGIFQIGQI